MLGRILRLYRDAFSGLPREVWLLAGVALVNRAGTMVLPFIALYLTQERGLSVRLAGQVLALYGLGSAAGSWLGGWLTDRLDAKRAQLISLVGAGAAFLWLGTRSDLAGILVGVLAASVLGDAFRPANMADIGQRCLGPAQVRAFALLRLAINVGWAVGPALGGLLALYDYFWLFVADAATCWMAAALLALALPRAPVGGSAAASRRSAPGVSPWRDGPFLLLMLWALALIAVFFQTLSTFPLYLRQAYGLGEGRIGLLLGFNALLVVLFEMVLVHWAERRDRRMPLMGWGAVLICAGFALLPLGSGWVWAALTVSVWSFGEMLVLPLMNAVVGARAHAGALGRYLGVYTMTFSAGFIVSPALGTWVYDRFGATALWAAVGAAAVPLWGGLRLLAGRLRPGTTSP